MPVTARPGMPPYMDEALLNEELIAWWPFSDASYADESGNGYNMGPLTDTWLIDSPVGPAITFLPGANQSLRCATLFTGLGSINRTIAGWYYANSLSAFMAPVAFPADDTATDQPAFALNMGGGVNQVYIGGSPYNGLLTFSPIANVWQHFAGSISSKTLTFYLNGALVGSATSTGTIGSNPIGYIGQYNFHYDEFFNGSVADVRVYNRALSAQEVAALYRRGLAYRRPEEIDLPILMAPSHPAVYRRTLSSFGTRAGSRQGSR